MADVNNSFNNNINKIKKRKKKSFMSHSKEHAKHGQYGLGVELQEDEYHYFMTLSEKLKTVSGEERDALLRSFFSEFSVENGERYVCNQIVSRMVDDLLPQASVESVHHLISIVSKDLYTMCTDQFASHVIQSVMTNTFKYIQKDSTQQDRDDDGNEILISVSDEEKESLLEFLLKMSKYCTNNLHEFMSERYASHVVRGMLEIMAGVTSAATSTKRAQTKHQLATITAKQHVQVPAQLTEMLLVITDRLMKIADLPSVVSEECGSAVYQCALQVLKPRHHTTHCSPLASHLLQHGIASITQEEEEEYYEEEDGHNNEQQKIHPVFHTVATCKLLEVVIECCSDEDLETIYSTYFDSQLGDLVQHGIANFAVQRIMESWRNKETFERVNTALTSVLSSVFECQHTGVLLAWTQACTRLCSQQGKCCVALMESLQCHEPEERQLSIAPLILHMMPYEQYNRVVNGGGREAAPKVSLHGALILQELLKFRKPIKAVKSLLEMPIPRLISIMQDPRGSFVIDVFCSSQYIGEKSKMAMVSKIKDDAVSMACSKHGSRSLEALWNAATTPGRAEICQNLAASASRMKGSEFGAILYAKFNIRVFSKANKQDWVDLEVRKANKRKKLKELQEVQQLTEIEPPKKKKKNKSKRDDLDALKDLLNE